ncbi:septum formation inhibitor Maf [Flagellimonas halotolerans]|uniref:Septum formation inhibitor Maf n=1 Tax=Flagellimonas halotolerans TaxID=3112164 RepID=A0ABU6ING8_9FLAO|nr:MULTISPECIES: septum formation inhibitor Maf [unclassified Allomuricauda]MEC3964752.1 septum formation inhibitor Maf [Muricauda sp. SYSU M86414]MEC4264621.1 septum formation inhibitor Maf [Muricauda sp. SYSU M84420]
MKTLKIFNSIILECMLTLFLLMSCSDKNKTTENGETVSNKKSKTLKTEPKQPLTDNFKNYWYAGDAEITSYQLNQARYGELREGNAVLIYVTEPFLPKKQVKADNSSPENISVLKLNATKNFLTGIYPYSIMSSTFYPVYDNQHAVKTSLSVQEWCGHVYAQINNREKFKFTSHSYFEGEADQEFSMEKSFLENEIWTKIRINPENLPQGEISMIPSLEFLRLRHKEMKAYTANATISSKDGITTYTISYPKLERKLIIKFMADFPFSIESWTEEFKSGFGSDAKMLTTSASKIKTLKTAYWSQNENKNLILRDSLGL